MLHLPGKTGYGEQQLALAQKSAPTAACVDSKSCDTSEETGVVGQVCDSRMARCPLGKGTTVARASPQLHSRTVARL